MDKIKLIEQGYLKDSLPVFNIGDSVDVHVKITEGDRERIQVFSGTVIARKGSGINESFTVRRIVASEGVERVFPLHSPSVTTVEVTRRGRVRRAKLYYLRDRVGKAVKVKELIGAYDESEKEKKVKKRGKKARAAKEAARTETEDTKLRGKARKKAKAKAKADRQKKKTKKEAVASS